VDQPFTSSVTYCLNLTQNDNDRYPHHITLDGGSRSSTITRSTQKSAGKHPCIQQDSNPRSQCFRGLMTCARPPRSAARSTFFLFGAVLRFRTGYLQ